MDADRRAVHSVFPKTIWERVKLAASGDNAAINDLYGKYEFPLRTFLFGKFGFSEVQAKEFVHDFLTERLPRCSAKANPQRGRFHSLLLSAFSNYVRDRLRHDNAVIRVPSGGFVSIDDPDVPDIPLPVTEAETELEWTRTVLAEVLRRLQAFYIRKGKERFWAVFEKQIVVPILEDTEPMPPDELVEKFGFQSPQAVYNALAEGKRKFQKFLKEVITEYAGDPDAAETEMRRMKNFLSGKSQKPGRSI